MFGRQSLRLGFVALALGCGPIPTKADGPPPMARPADYSYGAPSYVLEYDWSGVYVGGQAGAAFTEADWSYTGTLDTIKQSQTGFAGGGFVGVQKQWHHAVIGAEVGYLWAGLDQTSASALVADTSLSSSVKNLLVATGKVGYAWENALAYAKGGYATADVDFRTSVTSTGVVTTTSSGREHGWTAGLGLEYALRPNVIVGVEYDILHLSGGDRDQVPTPSGVAGTQVVGAEVDMQMVLARLSFKLGGR